MSNHGYPCLALPQKPNFFMHKHEVHSFDSMEMEQKCAARVETAKMQWHDNALVKRRQLPQSQSTFALSVDDFGLRSVRWSSETDTSSGVSGLLVKRATGNRERVSIHHSLKLSHMQTKKPSTVACKGIQPTGQTHKPTFIFCIWLEYIHVPCFAQPWE